MEDRKCILSIVIISLILMTILSIELDVNTGKELSYKEETGNIEDGNVDISNSFFIENKGQWDPEIRFLGRTSFGHIGIGNNCVFYNMVDDLPSEQSHHRMKDQRIGYPSRTPLDIQNGIVLKYTFEGSSRIIPEGVNLLEIKMNYFVGNDETKWISNAPCYERISLNDIWENIDIDFYFNDLGPKYDVIIGPGGNIDEVKFSVKGHQDLEIENGDLNVKCNDNKMLMDKDLVTFYEGSKDETIDSEFVISDRDYYSFKLGSYNKERTIVIDPLIFSSYLGGALSELDNGIDLDPSGNVVVAGYTMSDDFPVTPGVYQTENQGTNCFVSKFSPDGSTLKYSTYIGSEGLDYFTDLAVDSQGNTYIAGYTFAITDTFPTTDDAYDNTSNGAYEIFISKLNSNLSGLLYSSYFGGSTSDYDAMIEIDNNDNLYLACETTSADFPITPGAFDENGDGLAYATDFAVTKFSKNLSMLNYSTFISGGQWDRIKGLVVDDQGNAIIAGFSDSSNIPTTSNAYQKNKDVYDDGVIAKLNHDGSDLLYCTYLGAGGMDHIKGIALDRFNGNIYVVGETTSLAFPTTEGSFSNNISGAYDAFVTIFNRNCSSIVKSTLFGGTGTDVPYGIEVSNLGIVSICGYTRGIIPTTEDAYMETRAGGATEGYITTFTSDLSALVHSTYLGGSESDSLFSMTSDIYGNLFFTGKTNSTDFPVTSGSYKNASSGGYDLCVIKYSIIPNSEPSQILSLDVYSDQLYSSRIDSSDIGVPIYIEIIGVDSNSSNRDFAVINITSDGSDTLRSILPLMETGNDTGVFRSSYIIPEILSYFKLITFSSRKDDTFNRTILLDKPFRPDPVHIVRLFRDSQYSEQASVADYNDTIYIEIRGGDTNPLSRNTAFVNLTSDESIRFPIVLLLEETGINTGIYRGDFQIPPDMVYLEDLTVTSVRDKSKSYSIKISTYVVISPVNDLIFVNEDQEYFNEYCNGGWSTSLTWNFHCDLEWLTFDHDTLSLIGIPSNDDVGKTNVWISVQDDTGHSDEHAFSINVCNDEPTLIGENFTEVLQDEIFIIDYNSDDECVGDTTYHFATNATFLEIDKNLGVLTGIPKNADIGEFFINVWVDDGNGGKNTTTFDLVVKDVNDPPIIITTDITKVTQNDIYRRDYEVEDIDVGDSFTWSVDMNPSNDWLTINSITGLLYGEPGPEDIGEYEVNLTVTDIRGLSDSHVFNLIVENINDKPYFLDVPNDLSVYSGRSFIYDVNASDYDPDDNLEYSISSVPSSDISIDRSTGEIDWEASLKWFDEGPYQLSVEISLTDGEFTIKHNFKILVQITDPPICELVFPIDGSRSSYKTTLLEWEGSDPDGEEISYNVYIGSTKVFVSSAKEDTLYVSGYKENSLVVTGLDSGETFYWTVIPFDGGSHGECSNGVYSFRLNSVPQLNPVDFQYAKVGETFRLLMKGTDEDSDDLSQFKYSIEDGPNGMIVDERSGLIRWNPGSSDEGLHQVVVSLTDGVDPVQTFFTIEVEKGDETSQVPLYLFVGIPVLLSLLIIITSLIVIIRKRGRTRKNPSDNEVEEQVIGFVEEEKPPEFKSDVPLSPTEAHAHLGQGSKKVSYEDLYGIKAPIEENDPGYTTEELRDEIRKQIHELENLEE